MEGLSSKDVLQLIGVHLNDPFDIFALGMCCKHFCECLLQEDSEPMWRKLALLEESNDEEDNSSWKEKYISRKVCFLNFDAVVPSKRDEGFFGKIVGSLFKTKAINVVVVGHPGSGKTTVLKCLDGEFRRIGGACTCYATYKKKHFAVIEVSKVESLLKNGDFDKIDACIFVVDHCTKGDMDELSAEVYGLAEKLKQVPEISDKTKPILIYAHKQDQIFPKTKTLPEVVDNLKLHGLRGVSWYIQSSGVTDDLEKVLASDRKLFSKTTRGGKELFIRGIMDGFDWLHSAVDK